MSNDLLEESTTLVPTLENITSTMTSAVDLHHPQWLNEMEAAIRGRIIPW